MKIRGFEIIDCLKQTSLQVPQRKTIHSAGYDIAVIHPKVFELCKSGMDIDEAWHRVLHQNGLAKAVDVVWKESDCNSIILPTGIKAYMQPSEVLLLAIRSSKGIKKGIHPANPPSIIDADYYNNADNEGHIFFAVSNNCIVFDEPIMSIAQGIFMPYLVADNDFAATKRIGGIGSTDK